ncbi:MAG: hypothetical protein IPJ71_03885 [Bdellovibrionales bacterium]|nr:hypothetical protein [Bdellovibrionales bacterium]
MGNRGYAVRQGKRQKGFLIVLFFGMPLSAHAQGTSDPGCESTYQKMTTACLATKSAQEAAASSAITTMGFQQSTSIHPNANIEKAASQTGQAASANIGSACESARVVCVKFCGEQIKFHKAEADRYLQMKPPSSQAAKAQMDYAYIANDHMASCNTNLGTIASTSNTLAWTLGGAAVLAGAVALATKSGGSGDDATSGGSGNPETESDSSTSQSMSTDPTSPESNSTGTGTGSPSNPTATAGRANVLPLSTKLGDWVDSTNFSKPACFDSINDYCLEIVSSSRLSDSICSGFCKQIPHADSCHYTLSYNHPVNQQVAMRPRLGSHTQTGTVFRTQALDCSDSQMVNTSACLAPMTKYCAQYGTQGKGCTEFCKTHKNICKS